MSDPIEDITPRAAALVCAVADHHAADVATALDGLDTAALHALAILLAAQVPDDHPLAQGRTDPPSPDRIVELVLEDTAARFGISPDVIRSAARHREVVQARQVAMAAMRLAGLTSTFIGKAFARDHSTVLFAASRVGEDARLRRISRAIASPWATGLLGDESEVA